MSLDYAYEFREVAALFLNQLFVVVVKCYIFIFQCSLEALNSWCWQLQFLLPFSDAVGYSFLLCPHILYCVFTLPLCVSTFSLLIRTPTRLDNITFKLILILSSLSKLILQADSQKIQSMRTSMNNLGQEKNQPLT